MQFFRQSFPENKYKRFYLQGLQNLCTFLDRIPRIYAGFLTGLPDYMQFLKGLPEYLQFSLNGLSEYNSFLLAGTLRIYSVLLTGFSEYICIYNSPDRPPRIYVFLLTGAPRIYTVFLTGLPEYIQFS
jgi:hypothetical protein